MSEAGQLVSIDGLVARRWLGKYNTTVLEGEPPLDGFFEGKEGVVYFPHKACRVGLEPDDLEDGAGFVG